LRSAGAPAAWCVARALTQFTAYNSQRCGNSQAPCRLWCACTHGHGMHVLASDCCLCPHTQDPAEQLSLLRAQLAAYGEVAMAAVGPSLPPERDCGLDTCGTADFGGCDSSSGWPASELASRPFCAPPTGDANGAAPPAAGRTDASVHLERGRLVTSCPGGRDGMQRHRSGAKGGSDVGTRGAAERHAGSWVGAAGHCSERRLGAAEQQDGGRGTRSAR
jgi:hypothetical protein